jgi:hypothetical protein
VNSLWVRLRNVAMAAIVSADTTKVRVHTMVAFRAGSTERGIQNGQRHVRLVRIVVARRIIVEK